MEGEEQQVLPITPKEEKELHRVFETLCDFHKKKRLNTAIETREQQLLEIKLKSISKDGNAVPFDIILAKKIPKEQLVISESSPFFHEAKVFEEEIQQLKEELQQVTASPEVKIRANDLAEALKFLGKRVSKKEVQDIIWEVDENLDQCVDWEEFLLMFERNISDSTGLEPSQLFHMAQFMMYDQRNSGKISVDDTMSMLYARYGRKEMEVKLRILFGKEMKETGSEGGEITFLQYLEAVQKTQLEKFLATSLGKKSCQKVGRNDREICFTKSVSKA